jgi:putative nucleotidyltransferase with HDIG domain
MLSKLFGDKKKREDSANGKLVRLPDGMRQSIVSSLGSKAIPSMPKASHQAFQLATNPNADARDYIEVLETDEGLAARVLKIANSVFYDRGGGSKTIEQAVAVIGISELKGLLNASALSGIFPLRHPLRAQFWAHNIATALTARQVARQCCPSQTDQAFLGGMMHDVGKLLLLQQHTDIYQRVFRHGIAEGLESVVAESEEYPFNHTHVGLAIGEQWNFSPELVTIIKNHHDMWRDIEPKSLVGIVKASSIIANSLGLGAGKDAFLLKRTYELMVPEAFEHLGMPKPQQAVLLREAELSFNSEFELYESWGAG